MDRIDVTPYGARRFGVRVDPDDGPTTEHDVTVSDATIASLGSGHASPEAFVEACFRFLLEREPNTSILRSFDIDVIATHFPEFPDEIRRDG